MSIVRYFKHFYKCVVYKCATPEGLHYPQSDAFLSKGHAQSVVLLWTAVGENGSTHARTAGKTFNDFGDFTHIMVSWTE